MVPRWFPVLQVDYVEPSQNTISLKMIPRIDLDRIKAKMSLVGATLTAPPPPEEAASDLSACPPVCPPVCLSVEGLVL